MELLEPADGLYGSMQENNSWTGMVNDLIHDVSAWSLTSYTT